MTERREFNKGNEQLTMEKTFEDGLNWTLEMVKIEREDLDVAKAGSGLPLMMDTCGVDFVTARITRAFEESFEHYYQAKPTPAWLRQKLQSVCAEVNLNEEYF